MTRMPAISLAAVPGRRKLTLDLARRIEELGFSGIYCPSLGDALSLCQGIAMVTDSIRFGTSISPIYNRHVTEYAQTASFIHEISGGRFRFGIGVSHAPSHDRLGIQVGKPLADIRRFVEELRAVPRAGELPPIVLATLRDKMIGLSAEISDGMVFANGSRSFMAHSLSLLPEEKHGNADFFIGDMIPTCIHEDEAAAAAVNRRTLTGYAQLPNYRNYWKVAGYEEEMEGVEKAIAEGRPEEIPNHLSDRWLADCTLFGSVSKVREGVEAWFESGVGTPILVPSSAVGNQLKALDELFGAFS